MYVHRTEQTTVSECIKLSYLLWCENSSGDEDPSQGEKLLDKNTNKMSQNQQYVLETAEEFASVRAYCCTNATNTFAISAFRVRTWTGPVPSNLQPATLEILLKSLPHVLTRWQKQNERETVSCTSKQPLQFSVPEKIPPAQEVLKCASEGI